MKYIQRPFHRVPKWVESKLVSTVDLRCLSLLNRLRLMINYYGGYYGDYCGDGDDVVGVNG